ncbi:MAG: 16S rRNA (uracil(1498)-N(3))-methyltransferase [Flavobacteriales bacterium]|nr:16S rRNA (uracil(1498)-N(3))-methyltransferase [Flavobacteriales bacterium]
MQLYFSNRRNDNMVLLDEEESAHATRVMRLKEGDEVFVTNGEGEIFQCRIAHIGKKEIAAQIENVSKGKDEKNKLHIAIAPTKNIDRFEWFLEKSVELGIGKITPLICDRSERKEVRTDRLNKILLAAMKQSNHTHLPLLCEAVSFKLLMAEIPEQERWIAHCAEGEKNHLYDGLNVQQNTLVMIGPEGDFSAREIEQAFQHHFKPVSLGESRLRTETAGVAVAAMFALKRDLLKANH